MSYALLRGEFGQGSGIRFVPVAKPPDNIKFSSDVPLTAWQVVVDIYGEDFGAILENYIAENPETVQNFTFWDGTSNYHLAEWEYRRTESAIFQDTECTVVDFLVRTRVEALWHEKTINRTVWFRLRYILDMRPCERTVIGPIVFLGSTVPDDPVFNKNSIMTDEYLVPIIYKKDYEKIAGKFIDDCFPEAKNRTSIFTPKPEEIAEKMGFKIKEVHFADKSIMGQIYYNFGTVDLIVDGKVKTFHMKPGIILISLDNCSNDALRNSTLLHELCHMFLHRWFFLLQIMTGKPYAAFTSRRREKCAEVKTSLDWMEHQCDKLPAYILMATDTITEFAKKTMEKYSRSGSIIAMKNTINEVSEHFSISKQMAKIRLIDAGFAAANGIGIYQDGKYVPDHTCSGEWPAGMTYTIPAIHAARELEENQKLKDKVLNGYYVYVEGHFCINAVKYVDYRFGKIRLTDYAREHINECCVAFSLSGNSSNGAFNKSHASKEKKESEKKEYKTEYSMKAEPGDANYVRENIALYQSTREWAQMAREMPNDFKEAVKYVMKEKRITQENLAYDCGVDRKVIYNILYEEQPSIEHVVGLCVAMGIRYDISIKLLGIAGYNLRDIEAHQLYNSFLLTSGQMSVRRCNDILRSYSLKLLFNGEQDTENCEYTVV